MVPQKNKHLRKIVCLCVCECEWVPIDELVTSSSAIALLKLAEAPVDPNNLVQEEAGVEDEWIHGFLRKITHMISKKKYSNSNRVRTTVKGEFRKSLIRATGNWRKQTRKCRSEADMNVPLRLQIGQER